MLIACTNCETSYQVAPSSLGPTGRSVRCARCGYVWFAANTDAMEDIAQSHRGDIAAWADAAITPRPAAEHTGKAAESPPGDAGGAGTRPGRRSGRRGQPRFPDQGDPAGRPPPALGPGAARRCPGDRGGD